MYQGVLNIEQRQHTTALHENQTTRKPRATETGRKVIDIGALTIEEVRTARGEYAYKSIARTQKRIHANDLLAIYRAAEEELKRLGMLVPKTTILYDKYAGTRSTYYYAHREEIKAQMRERAYKKYHSLD